MGAQSEPLPAHGKAPEESANIEQGVGSKHRHTVPDARWINREIPITAVAGKLGLKGDGKVFDCFRDHPPGKRRRSLSVHGIANKMRCFTCDKHSLSNIDLVTQVQGCEVASAIQWIAANFEGVPGAEICVNHNGRSYKPSRARSFTLQDLVTSRGWASLRTSAQSVLTAVFARCPEGGSQQGCLRCTYNLLMQWTGIRSRATIAAALKELRNARAITTDTVPTNYRTRRGFWLKELFIRVSPRAMQRPTSRLPHHSATATSNSVQDLNPQYAVQNLNSYQRLPSQQGE